MTSINVDRLDVGTVNARFILQGETVKEKDYPEATTLREVVADFRPSLREHGVRTVNLVSVEEGTEYGNADMDKALSETGDVEFTAKTEAGNA